MEWDNVACCCGFEVGKIPEDLVQILEHLEEKIKAANGMSFGPRETFSLRSTQVLGLVVLLWEMGLLTPIKENRNEDTDHSMSE